MESQALVTANRIQSLLLRASSLPEEIETWMSFAKTGGYFEKNYSQLDAIRLFMKEILTLLKDARSKLVQEQSKRPPDLTGLLSQFENLETGIYEANAVWSYFRTKLEQRLVPMFSQSLFVADLVCYDCYDILRKKSQQLDLVHNLGLREYPLAFLQNESASPLTWPRPVVVPFSQEYLPLPLIGLPHDHIQFPWELLSIHHEISHDFDADFHSASTAYAGYLKKRLQADKIPNARIDDWVRWTSEIFADFMGIMLGGVPFVSFLITYFTLPEGSVYAYFAKDKHPIHYLRVLLDCRFCHHLKLTAEAQKYMDGLDQAWKGLYPNPPPFVKAYAGDFDRVIEVFMAQPLDPVADQKGQAHALKEFEFEDLFPRQKAASQGLLQLSAVPPHDLPLRAVPGAAQLAFQQLTGQAANAGLPTPAALSGTVHQWVKALAPAGQLPLRSRRSEQYIRTLADQYWHAATKTGAVT